jgi:DNA polymerase-3 subunit gamma/tau
MSQLALARCYRPRLFQEVVGQEAVLRALINALNTQRLHHAYLFSGTRGVGKTTLARILAKSLNCEEGISSTPCLVCPSCVAIDEGRFPDLLEVDAASRTKVEDTRELLDNVQYLPTRGRFKIYLIDEVHMLSGHSFNALLKTLEEPPPHVKFLLATTDPQKLPVTILSRCLQFHLRPLPIDKITAHLAHVLRAEKAQFEEEALLELARAAEGSMRDALSLLDQALAYGNGKVESQAVQAMLGSSQKTALIALLEALALGKGGLLLAEVKGLAERALDFGSVLREFLTLIHQVALAQTLPEGVDDLWFDKEAIFRLAKMTSSEEIQLYYQIGLMGQRDLPFAPSPKMGFEMTLLRMLAFQPARHAKDVPFSPVFATEATEAVPVAEVSPNASSLDQEKTVPDTSFKVEISTLETDWHQLVPQLKLTGLVKVLAEHCTVLEWTTEKIHLTLAVSQKPLLNKRHQERLGEALNHYFGKVFLLNITVGETNGETVAVRQQRIKNETEETIQKEITDDPAIQKLMQTFNAKIENITLKQPKEE